MINKPRKQLVLFILLAATFVIAFEQAGAGKEGMPVPLSTQGQVTPQLREMETTADPLVADFSANPLEGLPPLRVQFKSLSTGPFNSNTWDFGDGTTVNDVLHPAHKYMDEGRFTVTLTIRDSGGAEDTEVKTDYIYVRYFRSFVPAAMGQNIVQSP